MKARLHLGIVAMGAMLIAMPLKAQEDISNIFKAGLADVNKLMDGYMKPAGVGFAAGLGSNWYNTAATHKMLGFDLTLGVNGAVTPTSDQMFSLSGLSKLQPLNSSVTEAPTFAGKGDGVDMVLRQPATINGQANPYAGQIITQFKTPEGLSRYIPTANLQLTVGLPLGNDLSIRLLPTIKKEGAEASMWGIGLKHDVKQWIPVVKMLPFDASVFVGYTDFTLKYLFPEVITPDDLAENPNQIVLPSGNPDYSGQRLEMKANAFTANLIVSKKISFFTPYVGLGFTKSEFKLGCVGTYPMLGDAITTAGTNFGKIQVVTKDDPINVSYSNNMVGATAGFRLKILGVMAFHFQHTFQKYSIWSAGFGVNFR